MNVLSWFVENRMFVISTDSSLVTCGSVRENDRTWENWNIEEQNLQINTLEMKAVLLGLQALYHDVNSSHIRIKTDNTTCMEYINHKERWKSALANKIWSWAPDKINYLFVEFLPGALNTEADFEPRHQDQSTERSLNRSIQKP
ncbi:transposon ty3-g Gag-Pol polyprotein [Plakobranchus ocellatus]|uniref:Transposon ty3-g Gag-Pol polyprotein n=1 Tax=Plakobranchus ocellatus TaxID=259542 RepID=A0AAV3Y7L3_9GAST|nr:transposon ty3-g Gag-Pol polyprotein [Plakobranchus ocellatus]